MNKNDPVLRTCALTREKLDKRDLFRIVRDANGKVFIECGTSYNNVYLEFSDNGDGIPIDKREEIFNAFYTTSIPAGKISKSYEEMTGTGLGLKVVKDIINGYRGKIFVKEPTKGYSTTFRIEIPWEREGYKYDL